MKMWGLNLTRKSIGHFTNTKKEKFEVVNTLRVQRKLTLKLQMCKCFYQGTNKNC